MLKDDIQEVVSTPFEKVAATSLVLKLLDIYSKLYLYGGQPGHCEICLRDYYRQLKINGMELAEQYEQVKNRTCKPAWNGLRYISATARHWNSEWLTDKDAIYLLEKGFAKESDFEILPKGLKPIPEEKVKEDFEKRHAPKQVKKAKKNEALK